LAPIRWKKLYPVKKAQPVENKENQTDNLLEYRPFNISEMEVTVIGAGMSSIDNKQDEMTKLYQQLGLLMN